MRDRAPMGESVMLSDAGTGEDPSACPEAVPDVGDEEVWLKPIEVAQYLKVSRSIVYHWIRNGRMPHRRVGTQLRISRSILDALVESDALAL